MMVSTGWLLMAANVYTRLCSIPVPITTISRLVAADVLQMLAEISLSEAWHAWLQHVVKMHLDRRWTVNVN